MPYVVHKSGSGYKVFKKNSSKSYSKKPMSKEKAKAQQRALYASEKTNEALDLKRAGNLKFKGIYPNENEFAVMYASHKEPNVNVSIVYSLQDNQPDYEYFAVRDYNDPKGRYSKEIDPQSEASQQLLKPYNLTPEDIEMAGQDGYDKIVDHLSQERSPEQAFEESLEFERLAEQVLNKYEKEPQV